MCRFGARTDDRHSVVVDVFIVGPDSCLLGECFAIASDICGFRPNKANRVVDRSHLVVRDLKKERRDGLSKSCEVGVGRLSVNQLEVVKGVGEFL